MSSRLFHPLVILAVAILGSLTSLPGGFVYDDAQVIVRNERVTNPARSGDVWSTSYWGTRTTGGLYRPLTLFTFALNHRLAGLEPLSWHLVNVLLHALVCLLLYYVALEFLSAGGALAAALLFAAHPVHTEAVANLVGRAEILAALGFLAAWRLHGKSRILAALAFAAGAFSKEIAVVFPVVLLFRDVACRRKIDRVAYGLYGVVLIGYFAARYAVLGSFTNPKEMIIYRVDNVIATLPFLPGLWTALSVFGRYLGLLVFPWRLSADYSYPEITAASAGDPWAWLGLVAGAALLLAAAFALRAARQRPDGPVNLPAAVATGLALFTLAFFPVSNFLIRIGTVMAERLLYLPSAGFVLALAGAGSLFVRGRGEPVRRVVIAATALAILAGTALSLDRNRDWKDDFTLTQSTVQVSPRSSRARYNRGVALYDNREPEAAIIELEKAVELEPNYTEAWVNLGGYKLSLGRNAEARSDLLKAIELDSTWWSAYVTLGGLEITEGRQALALSLLERAVSLDSTTSQAWFNLALARVGVGDTTGAAVAMRRAVALNPTDPEALNNLAWYIVRSGGDLSEALRHAEVAVKLKADASTYDTLAEVLLGLGRRKEAREAWRKALAFPGAPVDSIRERLRRLGGDESTDPKG